MFLFFCFYYYHFCVHSQNVETLKGFESGRIRYFIRSSLFLILIIFRVTAQKQQKSMNISGKRREISTFVIILTRISWWLPVLYIESGEYVLIFFGVPKTIKIWKSRNSIICDFGWKERAITQQLLPGTQFTALKVKIYLQGLNVHAPMCRLV